MSQNPTAVGRKKRGLPDVGWLSTITQLNHPDMDEKTSPSEVFGAPFSLGAELIPGELELG